MMKVTAIVLFFALLSIARAANEEKKKELNSQCGRDLRRGEYFGEITDLDDFPWLALLRYDTPGGELKNMCGGVLISDRYVLTAAHCVDSPSNQLRHVILGEYNTETDPDCVDDGPGSPFCNQFAKYMEVKEVILHESYNPLQREGSETKADLALLKLSSKVKFNQFVQPICLPESPEKAKAYFVGGWGKSMAPGGDGFTVKRVSRAAVLAPQQCSNYPVNPGYSSEDHICAGAGERVSVADAGGALMTFENKKSIRGARMTVFGIGFMDLTCKFKELPGVFTKVHKYVPWIEKHIFS